ncbi:MAG TPA: carboxypeptidase-like regulatory domain-containing protein [Thermoanaerobaculia bacterium]
MRRFRAIAVAAMIVMAAAPAQSDTPLPAALQVLGNVTNAARPVGNALIIALNLNTFAAAKTWTAKDGSFTLPPLAAGVYRIIAVKQGFAPATATVAPPRADHRLAMKLEPEKHGARKSTNQEIWEIRGSLPSDILRELDLMLEPAVPLASYELPRIRGEMVSMTGVAEATAPAFAQTALGVQGRIGENWQLGIRGNLQRIADSSSEGGFRDPLAESNVVSMELRSSPTDAYRVASTKSSWRYADDRAEAAVQAHNFEWEHGPARVQVRYLAQDNLTTPLAAQGFASGASNMIEIAGNTTLLQTRRNDLGVSIRMTQESVTHATSNTLRTADLAANGMVEVAPSLVLHYGMASRLGVDGQEWAPRTGAEWRITKDTSIIASAMLKLFDHANAAAVMPSIVYWTDDARIMPRYTYSLGFISGRDENNRLTAVATLSAIDTPLRVVFNDGYDQFWDGLYMESGDVRRDVRLAYRGELGNHFVVAITTVAGTATRTDPTVSDRQKIYVTGDLQSTFRPTGTTIAVSYRELQQPRREGVDYRSERVHVRMAQSLWLPLDMKLLLGMELARAENSPFLLDALVPEGESRKWIGGLAVNF